MSGPSVRVHVPGDKSISHRALLLTALADGVSRLRGVLPGDDPRATARVLRDLGVRLPALPADGSELRIVGVGLRGLRASAGPLDCGNSGTTARLMLGILAACPFASTLTGDASLRARPMRRVTDPLSRMGARFTELSEPDRLPIRVRGGRLRSIDYEGPRASAQVKSAILLAGLVGGVAVRVTEPNASRDHTERMLGAAGVRVATGTAGTGRADAGGAGPDHRRRSPSTADRRVIELEPADRLEPLDLTVPGDFSSAAFLLALGLLADRGELVIPAVGVNPTRTGLLDVLRRMGAAVERRGERTVGGETIAELCVRPAALRGTVVTGAEIPGLIDEVPVLAVLAARADGETRVSGAGELRVKESDRLGAIVSNLRAIGVEADELDDGFVVHGTDAPLHGAVRAFDDHRIAMAFGVLAALPNTTITIDDQRVADVSFPGFWPLLARTARELNP